MLHHDYIAALDRQAAAQREIRRQAAILERFATNLLEHPGETCFVDLPDEPVPPLDELIPGARWYAPQFPTPGSIQAALRDRHEARAEAHRLWKEMSPQQRRGLPTPPR